MIFIKLTFQHYTDTLCDANGAWKIQMMKATGDIFLIFQLSDSLSFNQILRKTAGLETYWETLQGGKPWGLYIWLRFRPVNCKLQSATAIPCCTTRWWTVKRVDVSTEAIILFLYNFCYVYHPSKASVHFLLDSQGAQTNHKYTYIFFNVWNMYCILQWKTGKYMKACGQ